MFVIVLSTTIAGDEDLRSIRNKLNAFLGQENWHCDLDDPDKILSIQIESNLSLVFALLDTAPFLYCIINIYDTRLGIDHPFFDNDFGGIT